MKKNIALFFQVLLTGIQGVLFLIILSSVLMGITGYQLIVWFFGLISTSTSLESGTVVLVETGVILVITFLSGIFIRKFVFPTNALSKKEVMWETFPGSDRHQSGILMGIEEREIKGERRRLARVMIATGGPTSMGGMSETYVPEKDIIYLGTFGSDAFKRLWRLGNNGKKKQTKDL